MTQESANSEGLKIILGAGPIKRDGWLRLDKSAEFNPDLICDLEKGIPLEDNSVIAVQAHHILEHIHDLIGLMNDIWRVCKHGAFLDIAVPDQSSYIAFADPTHVRIFNQESFGYFVVNGDHYWIHKSYGIKCRFFLINQEVVKDKCHGVIKVAMKAIKDGGVGNDSR